MTYSLHTLQRTKTTKPKRRLGRGAGSSKGKTSGRGHKGYKARSGSSALLGFEGGQMPLIARIPKLKGFHNINQKVYQALNVQELEKYAKSDTITKETLVERGFLKEGELLKILGTGEIKKAITVEADAASASAREKIEKAGGKITIATRS